MAMKTHTRRWLFAVGVAGSLLAMLFYLDRSAPTVQFTQAVGTGHSLLARRAPAPGAAAAAGTQPLAGPVRERYIVQAASGERSSWGRAASQPPR